MKKLMARPLCCGCALVLGMVGTAAGQIFSLEDATRRVGIETASYVAPFGMTAGVAAADYNNNGWIDIFVPNAEGHADQLFVNNGDGTFTEMALDLGVSGMDHPLGKPRSRVALWVDVDGDRRLDLIVAGDAFFEPLADLPAHWNQLRLYRQLPDGTFEDASEAFGLHEIDLMSDCWCLDPRSGFTIYGRHFGSMAAGDLNGDGYLDLVVGVWQGAEENKPQEIGARILLNLPDEATGGRRFQDVTIETLAPGIAEPGLDHFGSFWQIVLHDFNGDGLLDIYGAVDMDENHLWLNQGRFEDPSRPGVFLLHPMVDATHVAGMTSPVPETDMGIALGDPNNDGLIDAFITKTDTPGSIIHNDFYIARSAEPVFENIAQAARLMGPRFGFGWGTTFRDMDMDGFEDLLVTNGFNSCIDRPVMMINRAAEGDPRFIEQPSLVLNAIERGACIIGADLDRDGDIDLIHTVLMTPSRGCQESVLQILENVRDPRVEPASWVTVRPRMKGPNHFAIGAVVRVECTGETTSLNMTRVLTAGISMGGQEPAEANFGLGIDTNPEDALRITIQWPDGSAPTVLNGTVASLGNRLVHVGPCSVVDLAEPAGSLDFFDLLDYLNRFEAGDMVADLAEPFGVLDASDLFEAIRLVLQGCP